MNDVAPSIVVRFDSARSAEPPHSSGSTAPRALSTLPRRGAGRDLLAGLEDRAARRRRRRAARAPASRSSSALRSGFAAAQASKRLLPLGVRGGAALARASRVCSSTSSGDVEGLVGVEAEHLLDGGELVGAERGAVDLAGVLLAGGGPADDRLAAR